MYAHLPFFHFLRSSIQLYVHSTFQMTTSIFYQPLVPHSLSKFSFTKHYSAFSVSRPAVCVSEILSQLSTFLQDVEMQMHLRPQLIEKSKHLISTVPQKLHVIY